MTATKTDLSGNNFYNFNSKWPLYSYIKRKDRKLGIRAERFFKDFIDRLTRLKEPAWEFYLTVSWIFKEWDQM
jgi:hypothetical protein